MKVTLLQGDCLASLRTLPDACVQTCVTSPPYFGLRDYGVDGQIGLEATPDEFVAKLVDVFREVRRVMKDDGTCWVNLGDSYAGSGRGGHVGDASTLQGSIEHEQECRKARGSQLAPGLHTAAAAAGAIGRAWVPPPTGLKQKDLMGMPWRVAFALQADGWYLRQDIIWHKPNPMPESVRDRCTKSHEYLFLLSKRERYYFDADAIAEPASSAWDPDNAKQPDGWDTGPGAHGAFRRNGRERGRSGNVARKPASARGVPVDDNARGVSGAVAGSVPWEGTTRNRRSVWTVPTKPYAGAHFATFPPELITPCILAGSRPGDTVLDPFNGSGTTGQVALDLGRAYIGCEINPDYIALTQRRIAQVTPGLPLEVAA